MFSPLEQFEVYLLYCSFFSFSNANIVLLLIFFVLIFFFNLNIFFLMVPNRYQYLFEQLVFFIKNLIESNIGSYYLKYFSFLFSLFLFILLANLFGMVPYSFTLTSHLILTFCLSTMCFVAINFIGLEKHGLKFLGLFFPTGSPILLAPLLVFIEILSYFARVFSLAIRLFANLMSGHTLLKILSDFGWVMLTAYGLGSIFFLFPTLIILLITGLEIAIGFLQAYVFVILVCIYLNDALYLH